MATLFGVCALCRKERHLQDSHFLPKALYRYVRAKTGAIRSPIIVGSDSARNTDRQFTKHLLCQECEQRFSRNGEAWTMKQAYRGSGAFRLLTALDRYAPVAVGDGARIYAAKEIAEIDLGQLTYFALSVFWRGAVTDWKIDGQSLERLEFGDLYMSALQEYLLGDAATPEHIALALHVCDDPTLTATTLATPMGGRNGGYHSYIFIIPGLAFHLFIGKRMPALLQRMSLCGPTKGLVLRSNYEDFLKGAFFAKMQTAQQSSALIAFTGDSKNTADGTP
jgi:hypothetical protein